MPTSSPKRRGERTATLTWCRPGDCSSPLRRSSASATTSIDSCCASLPSTASMTATTSLRCSAVPWEAGRREPAWQPTAAPHDRGPDPRTTRINERGGSSGNRERKHLIEARARAVVEEAVRGGVLGTQTQRDPWLSEASTVAAYRDRHGITSDLSVGGGAQSDSQRAARACVPTRGAGGSQVRFRRVPGCPVGDPWCRSHLDAIAVLPSRVSRSSSMGLGGREEPARRSARSIDTAGNRCEPHFKLVRVRTI